MASDNTLVETRSGPVRGHDDGHVTAWKGVRYAAPPVGDLRWRAPQPAEGWTDVADATRFGRVCPQPVDPRIPIDLGAPQDEDCLTLNIWASSDTTAGDRKPVMVWVHGGAYILGSASQPLYDGRVLAGGGEAIVVTVNYRLGALGFLDLSEFDSPRRRFDSNLGLRDVLAALQWVRDNIAAFGGDPGRVTLFGESAGAGDHHHTAHQPGRRGPFLCRDRAELTGHLGLRHQPGARHHSAGAREAWDVGVGRRPAARRAGAGDRHGRHRRVLRGACRAAPARWRSRRSSTATWCPTIR